MRKNQEAKKKPEKPVLSIEDPIRNKMQTDENSGQIKPKRTRNSLQEEQKVQNCETVVITPIDRKKIKQIAEECIFENINKIAEGVAKILKID